ncbi:MAG: outer membrane lipoprotein-sorting protein [Rubrivivax sp.]
MFSTISPARLALGSRRWFAISAAGVALAACFSGSKDAIAADAPALAAAVFQRPSGRDVTSLAQMTLRELEKMPRNRELVTFRLDPGPGQASSLVRFLAPADIKGTGLLVKDKAVGSEQLLYLPELDRVRRVAGDRKGGRFVGSDIYYQDLESRDPALDTHRTLKTESLLGKPCEVIESIPRDGTSSTYRKVYSWVDPETLLVLRIDYFETESNVPTKRFEALEIKNIQGFWTVTDSRVTNLVSGHETRLKLSKISYNRKLPARLFTAQALADESIEEEFRP